MSGEKTAIEAMLAGLIDYAGLYPPASLDMRRAVDNYLAYRAGKYAYALGRFIVDVNRMDELRSAAGNDYRNFRVSLIAAADGEGSRIIRLLDEGARIESVELKVPDLRDLDQIAKSIPASLEAYVEVPIDAVNGASLEAIAAVGMRLKLRMGGVVPDAFPSSRDIARALSAVSARRFAFKATAGLHHPIRAPHRLTYSSDSPTGMMHGFVNLFCAASLLHFGGNAAEAEEVLEEQDRGGWDLTAEALCWRSLCWTRDQLAETRKTFVSFGSCSFEEPIRDLEAMGWL